jgi:hypothetical protein
MPPVSPNEFFGEELRQAIYVATVTKALIVSAPAFTRLIFLLKVAALVITTFLAIGITILLLRLNFFSSTFQSAKHFLKPGSISGKEKLSRQWERIKARLSRGSDADLRLAVIEADQLLDTVLKRLGVGGNTLSEKLERLRPWQLENLPDLRLAHKIRNRLVHEPASRITPYEAETTLQIYERALKSLGVLD